MKMWLFLFLLCLATTLMFSCNRTRDSKIEKPNLAVNYKLSWISDTSSIVLSKCSTAGLSLNESTSVQQGDKVSITKVANNDTNKIRVLDQFYAKNGNGVLSEKNSKTNRVDTILQEKLINTKTELDKKQHLLGYQYQSTRYYPNEFSLKDITIDSADFSQSDSTTLNLINCKVGNINIRTSYAMMRKADPGYLAPIVNLIIPLADSSVSNQITIFGKELGYICPGQTNEISIEACVVSGKSTISIMGLDTLSISYLSFKHKDDKLFFSILGVDKKTGATNVVAPFEARGGKKRQLLLSDVDASRLFFDYRFFNYCYEDDDNYFKVKQKFKEIISSQRIQNNQEGAIDASIDSAKFEDKQHFLTNLFIPVKSWWNNYGYDKGKVIISSLELFCLVWLINLILFRELLDIYSYDEISKEQKASLGFRSTGKRMFYLSMLCLIYSGYLFFGLNPNLEVFTY